MKFLGKAAIAAVATAVGVLGATVPAHADDVSSAKTSNVQVTPQHVLSRHSGTQNDDGTVTITATVVGSSIASATAKSTSEATGSSYAYAVAWATSHAKIDRSKCEWSTGINTYWSGGVFHRYYDPVKAHICRLVHPVTVNGVVYHWKKVGGGTSGEDCGNLFVPKHENVSYTRVAFLDVKAGTVAKVGVHSKVCVAVNVNVNVELQYTYQGETHTVYKTNSASDSACKSAKATARKRITKHTTRRASARTIAKAKAAVHTKAKAKATARAKAKARAKAVATVSVTITITPPPSYTPPTVSASANGCVGGDTPNTTVNVSFADGNKGDTSATVKFDSQPSKTVSLTNGQGSTTFTVSSAGSYSGTVTGNPSGMSAPFSVPVQQCDIPEAPAPDVTLNTMNQVIETKSATTGLGVQVYGGDSATVTISTLWGQITTTKTFNSVTGSWNNTVGYTAPGEIPDGSQSFPDTPPPPAGSDQVRVVVVDNQTGKKVVAYTNVKITPFVPAP